LDGARTHLTTKGRTGGFWRDLAGRNRLFWQALEFTNLVLGVPSNKQFLLPNTPFMIFAAPAFFVIARPRNDADQGSG